jgi:DNA-binding MarR family transcriptional regulator
MASEGRDAIVNAMPKRNGRGIELLADPTRRQLIAEIALRPRRPSSLAEDLGLSRPATSRQLKLLRDAGLIATKRSTLDRRVVIYVIAPRARGPITAWLAGTQIGRPIALRIDDDGTLRRT